VYNVNPYQLQEAFKQLARHGRDPEYAAAFAALRLYQRMRRRGWLGQLWTALTGQTRHLFDLGAIEAHYATGDRRHGGCRTVPLRQIRGSEGRCREFDLSFHPLQSHSAARWLSIATASRMGVALPPVELIQVGDVYFVRDGHHRISVARALGQTQIDAKVTVWQVSRPMGRHLICPPTTEQQGWPSRRFRHVVGQLCTLLVALGARLVAHGLPPYHPQPLSKKP
jgi:hypothetical protein